MARSVRVIDSPEYVRERPDVEVVDTGGSGLYGRRSASGSFIVVLLVLLLIVALIYRNGTEGFFGGLMSETPAAEPPISAGVTPVEREALPVVPPVAPAGQPSDVIGYTRVAVEQLNLRAGPGDHYAAIYVLPRNWQVAILRQLHIANDGEAWVEVMVETNQGWQRGWVSQRYLEACDCPTYGIR
jgi:hypothetical protein